MNRYLTLASAPGNRLRDRVKSGQILPLIGVYDVFSASLAARRFEGVFCSGYGFSASHYGLPDEGFIAWSDLVAFVERVRAVIPDAHIAADIDDGFGGPDMCAMIAKKLESAGASSITLEDQKRPKKCGHLPGKEILPLDEYMAKLEKVLAAREHLFVIARTDATCVEEGLRRARAFAAAGADAVLVEGLPSIDQVARVRDAVGPDVATVVNLIAGGKTPPVTLTRLSELGAQIVVYSTPCLFAAQKAVADSLADLSANDGALSSTADQVVLADNNQVLKENLQTALGSEEPLAVTPSTTPAPSQGSVDMRSDPLPAS